jgi:Predicted Zn-dependent peptidases
MDICIKQEKFHQLVFKKYRISKLNKETLTIRNLLCYYQELSCKKYNTEARLDYILGDLYDAKYHVRLTTYGSYSVIEYTLKAIDPMYIEDETYTLEKLETIFLELIEPVMQKGQADAKLFARAVEIYESDLLSRSENLQLMSYQNAMELYFKGTNRAFSPYGYLDEVKKITKKDLYSYFLEVQKEETISFLTGKVENSIDLKDVTLTPKKEYQFKERAQSKARINEPKSTLQSYIEIIYELGIYANDPLYYAAVILNHILGGASNSLLFQTIREKLGLCYSISSLYLGATGILVVSAIVNSEDVEDTLCAIDKIVDNFLSSPYSLKEIKAYYTSNYYLGEDFIDTKINQYLSDTYFLDSPKSKEELKKIKSVTKQDVIEAYQKLKKAFTYVLGGETDEK